MFVCHWANDSLSRYKIINNKPPVNKIWKLKFNKLTTKRF